MSYTFSVVIVALVEIMHPLEELSITARGLTFPALACGAGPLVLCLHGFPDTYRSFRHQLLALARAGYRAVSPALRGYAPSCMPELEACNALEAAHDAAAIVEALGEERAHLVGHDWGAVVAYLAGRLAANTWRSITTMAAPHPLGMLESVGRVPRQMRLSWYMAFFQVPRLPERTIAARDYAFIERLWRTWSPGFIPARSELDVLKRDFDAPGVVQGALAYYRNAFNARQRSSRDGRALLLGRIDTPVLALTGATDGCIDTRIYDHAMSDRFFEDIVVERMQGVGHFLHHEDPERVSARLVDFVREHG